MSIHQVKQGECLSSIAHQYGFHWKTLWNHPDNKELKENRKNPNILYPEDEICVPEKEEKYESGETGKKHRFVVKGKAKLRIQVLRDGAPWAGVEYTLAVEDKKFEFKTNETTGEQSKLKTDQKGILEHLIAPGAKEGKLLIGKEPKQREFPLKIGHLDPIEKLSGVQARLKNLLLYQGPIDGTENEALTEAVAVFQGYCGLTVTGKLGDEDMKKKLQKVHDTSQLPVSPLSIMPPSVLKNEKGPEEKSYYVCRSVAEEKEKCNTFDCRTVVAIDAHMHVMSAHCTPAPLIDKLFYDKIRALTGVVGIRKRQGGLGFSGTVDLGIGKKCTSDIAKQAIEDNDKTYEKLKDKFPKNFELFTPMVALCVDFEYAHIKGYEGKTVYYYLDKDGGRKNYYGDDPSREVFFVDFRGNKRTLGDKAKQSVELGKSPFRGFEPWQKQLEQTIQVVRENPWKLIPFFHYEPRRWLMDDTEWKGKKGILWFKEPFQEVATRSKVGLFVGFKMYTSLGYKPLDPKLPGMSSFYQKCQAQQIPIMAHCTPGGSYTHERELYLDWEDDTGIAGRYKRRKFLKKVKNVLYRLKKTAIVTITISEAENVLCSILKDFYLPIHDKSLRKAIKEILKETGLKVVSTVVIYSLLEMVLGRLVNRERTKYFQDHFVRPSAWHSVLSNHKTLKLCLAHVGGNPEFYKSYKWFEYDQWTSEMIKLCVTYPNVYTDVSDVFHTEKDRQFIKRELFYDAEKKRNKRIFYKVLFGTDWYVTNVEYTLRGIIGKNDVDYDEYCLGSKRFLDEVTNEFHQDKLLAPDEDLWTLFTLVNPFRYLGFVHVVGNKVEVNTALIDNIALGLADQAFDDSSRDGKVFDELQRNTEIIKCTAQGVAHYLNSNEERRQLVTWKYGEIIDSPIDILPLSSGTWRNAIKLR